MPKSELTEMVVALDRLDSMALVRHATIETLIGYIHSQKAGDGEVRLTLIQFDDRYKTFLNAIEIGDVPMLMQNTFEARGSMALFDAIGRTIVETGKRYARIPDAARPGNVLFVIQTDGYKNASKQYSGGPD